MTAVGARNVALVGTDERPVADDVVAADDEPVDTMRPREDEAGHRVGGASELEPVRPPDGEVGAFAGLERADVVPAQDCRTSACSKPKRIPRRQRPRPAAAAGYEEGLLHLEEEVAPLVRRGAVHAQPDAHP